MEARAYRFISKLGRRKPDESDRSWPFKLPPKDYQLGVFAAARFMPFFALAPVATGTGKTKMLIDIAADKFMRGEIDGAMVVAAPGGVPRQWVEEALPEHMTPAVKWVGALWKSTRQTDRRVARPSRGRMRWLAFKVEAFSRENSKAEKAARDFLTSGRMMLIWDESSRGKNPNAQRTKAFIGTWSRGKHTPGLGSLAVSRANSSGTPITKGLEDLWAQFEFLDPKILGMSNYYAFRARYCVTVPAFRGAGLGAVKIGGYRNTEEFVRKIAPTTFVVPKEVLGLDKPIYTELPVEATREQKMAYNALRNQLVDDLAEMKIASPINAAVRYVRLQQVLCGRVYEQPSDLEEPPFAKPIASNRIATLLEYVDANPGPNVIWARFTQDILDIEEALRKAGRNPVTYYGDVSDEDRALRKKAFMAGDATDFVANAATAGMGLDGLQKVCWRAIFYSGSFNREFRWQAVDRLYRMQQIAAAQIIDMIVPKSIDRTILDSYRKTEELIASLMTRPELVPILGED